MNSKKKITVMDDIPEKFFNKRKKRSSKTLKDVKTIYSYQLPKLINGITSIFSIKYIDTVGNTIDKLVRHLPKDKTKPTKEGVWLLDVNAKKKNIEERFFLTYSNLIAIGTSGEIYIIRKSENIKLNSL